MWQRLLQRLDPGQTSGDSLGAPLLWPGGHHVAANGLGRVFLWELATGACSRVLETQAICRDGDPSFRLACEPEFGRVLEAHAVRDFAVWDSTSWSRLQTFTGHEEAVRAATFLSEDRLLSISGDGTVRLWDAWTGKPLRTLETVPLYALAASPTRELVAVGGGRGTVLVLDALGLEVRATLRLPMAAARHEPLRRERKEQLGVVWNRPSDLIQALAWHPDGEHLVCGSWDFVARMFHRRTGHVVREWMGHAHWVGAVAIEPSRRLLVTGSSDGTVRVWSLDSPECLAVYDVGHANLGGLLLHDGAVYVTCRDELLRVSLPGT